MRTLPKNFGVVRDVNIHNNEMLWDVTRAIAQQQNWAWANLGSVFACDGFEPMATQTATIGGTSATLTVARCVVPLPARTLGARMRWEGIATITGASVSCTLRIYQLAPHETEPDGSTEYDERTWTSTGSEFTFSEVYTPKVSGKDIRIVIELRTGGSNGGTLELLTLTGMWASPGNGDNLSTLPSAWHAKSQAYVSDDRPASAMLLRYLANMTYFLVARRRPIFFCHSFVWNRRSTTGTGTTRVAIYRVLPDGVGTTSNVTITVQGLVTGNATVAKFAYSVNGGGAVDIGASIGAVASTYALTGASRLEAERAVAGVSITAGSNVSTIEILATVTTATDTATNYTTNVGIALCGCQIVQDADDATTLGLPGVETVPANYQPLEDDFCAPFKPVVRDQNRIPVNAGPYYLLQNLIWLAANRGRQTLISDWLFRSRHGFWNQNATTPDTKYRRSSILQVYLTKAQSEADYTTKRGTNNEVPWTDVLDPAFSLGVLGVGLGGPNSPGTVLGRYPVDPVTGGALEIIASLYQLDPSGQTPAHSQVRHEYPTLTTQFFFNIDGAGRSHLSPEYYRPETTTSNPVTSTVTLQGAINVEPYYAANEDISDAQAAMGFVPSETSLSYVCIRELPLTQTDLDAL